MKRFSLIINHTSEDSHSAVLSSWDVDKEGQKTNIEAKSKTHKDGLMALNSMINFVNKRLPPIDYTPPTLSNIGVIIPEKFEWVFANDRFEINGFVVDFARVNGQLAVDVAYLLWEAFLVEVNLPQNAVIKRSLDPIWEHVETEFELGNTIKL